MKRCTNILIALSLFLLIVQGPSYSQNKENEAENKNMKTDEVHKADQTVPPGDKKNAPEQKNNGSEIIITATKTEIIKRETGASITVISSDQIEKSQKMNLVDILKNTPALTISSSSSLGGLADMYIRGSQSNHVVVLVDGVKVNDPSAPTNGFDFAHLTTDNIERVEIVRGSQSTLYGSDAIGGVVNIITKKGKGKPQFNLMAEGGSYYTFKELAGVSGSTDWAFYSFAVSRLDSNGYTKTSSWHGVKQSVATNDNDGYHNTSVSTRGGIKTFHDSWLTLALRYTDSETEIDDGAFKEDKNSTMENNNLSFNITYSIPIFKWWDSSLIFNYLYQLSRYKDSPDVNEYSYVSYNTLMDSDMWFKGNRIGGEFKNKFKIMDIDEIICGVSYDQDAAATMPWYYGWSIDPSGTFPPYEFWMNPTDPIDKTEGTWAVYLQNHLKLFDRVFIIVGGRYTQPEHFDYSLDYSISGSFNIPVTETRLKGNVGTGFKVPSLYERYNIFGPYSSIGLSQLSLKPERSLSYDVGIEQPLWGSRIVLEANFFSIDYTNMIVFDTFLNSNGMYYNISALSQGVECIATFRPVEDLSIEGHYTYNFTEQKKVGHTGDLLRRPEHQGGFIINYSFLNKGNVNLSFRYVGYRLDYSSYPNYNSIEPYYTFDLAASWWIIDQLQAFFRIENLLNMTYEEVRGYRMPGISFYGGLKAQI